MDRVSGSGEDGLIRCSITDSVKPQGRSKATSIRDARISTTLVQARNWCPQPGFMLRYVVLDFHAEVHVCCIPSIYLVYTQNRPHMLSWESAAIQRGLV